MLWLCIHFPRLVLEALQPAPGTPVAVVDGPEARRRIVLASETAQVAGVRPGLPLATARALCPALVALARDPAAERQAMESLAALAWRFSDRVSPEGDNLLLEIGASLKLFKGWARLERRLRGELATTGFSFRLAAAGSAAAARVWARLHDGFALPGTARLDMALGAVSLADSGLPASTTAALQGMGFRQLRDLFRLPRPELARRIGREAMAHLDRLRGRAAEVLPGWRPAERFERRIELPCPAHTTAALAFPLQRLLRELALFLQARESGVQQFLVLLGHDSGRDTRIDVGLLRPRQEADVLLELARERLERTRLAAPVQALALVANQIPALRPLHQDLFDPRQGEPLAWEALVERLRARLGDEALGRIDCRADHRPGRAWRRRPATAGETPTPAAGDLPPRPFWLLRRPRVLRERPRRILAGPERIESGWWDGHDQRRDYYVIETCRGQRAWVFLEAGTTPGLRAPWTLHGWFA